MRPPSNHGSMPWFSSKLAASTRRFKSSLCRSSRNASISDCRSCCGLPELLLLNVFEGFGDNFFLRCRLFEALLKC